MGITWGIAGLLAVLFIFKAGMVVGTHKAGFTRSWGENYHRNFGGPQGGFFQGFGDRDFISAHGVAGQIIKVELSGDEQATLVIKGRDEVEKIVIVNKDTAIKGFGKSVKLADLKADDLIVVIGEPNDVGQIEAKFIRVLPPLGVPLPGKGR